MTDLGKMQIGLVISRVDDEDGWVRGGGWWWGTADDVGQLAHDQPCNAPLLRMCVLIINTSQVLRRN